MSRDDEEDISDLHDLGFVSHVGAITICGRTYALQENSIQWLVASKYALPQGARRLTTARGATSC